MELCRLSTWSCSMATSRCSSIISLLAPKAKGDSAKSRMATRDKLIKTPVGREAPRKRPAISLLHSLAGRQMRAAVLLPASFVGVGTLRAFLTVADGFQVIGGDAQLDQEVLGGGSAAIAQREVIFGGAALIAVAFDDHREVGILLEDLLEQ